MMSNARLISNNALPENGVWWTDIDCLQTRVLSASAVEPFLPDTKRYSYEISQLPFPEGVASSRSSPPPPFSAKEAKLSNMAAPYNTREDEGDTEREGSISTFDGMVDKGTQDMAGFTSERRQTLLQRRRSEWRREFDLRNEWSHAWLDYRLHSSIHGVKQAAEPQPFLARRVLWSVILLGSVAVFLYMTTKAVSVYFTWPVVLQVNTIYQTNIRFPAVTVCNQNAFRVTASAENGWYDILTAMFSSEITRDDYLARVDEFANVSMLDIYMATGHTKHDMIKSCFWDGRPCNMDDFDTVLTDHGLCYTFNGVSSEEARYATHTGVGSGLTILVNIEQYEYMPGPSRGAGLRLLIHNQEEFPLVRDKGFVLPKGSHSFVGLKHIKTQYLPPPYGHCDKRGALKNFDVYNKADCMEDCLQLYLALHCGCRHFYMPAGTNSISNDSNAICTISQYEDCVKPAAVRFEREQADICHCPEPCQLEVYETETSLGAVSNFELLNMMFSASKGNLEEQMLKAKWVTDRNTKDVAESDTSLIEKFIKSVRDIDDSLHVLLKNMESSSVRMDQTLHVMNIRSNFHETGGFGRMSSYLDSAFTRGWDTFKERALDHLAANLYSISDTYELVMAKVTSDMDESSKQTLWLVLDNDIRSRIDLSRKAEEYIETTYTAFTTGTPILAAYKETYKGHFDETFIDINLLTGEIAGNEGAAEWVKEKLVDNIQVVKDDLNNMRGIANNYFNGRATEIVRKEIKDLSAAFVQTSRSYISRLLTFETRIIANLPAALNKKIDAFHLANRTLHDSRADLGIIYSTIKSLVANFNTTIWRDIVDKAKTSQAYLDDTQTRKSRLAKELTDNSLHEKLGDFGVFFNAIRARGRDLVDRWMELKHGYLTIWQVMLQERSLQRFYRAVQEAYDTYALGVDLKDNDIVTEYAAILSDLLNILPYEVKEMELEDLRLLLNADFNKMDFQGKLSDIDDQFGVFINSTNIMETLENLDMEFQDAFDQYERSMTEFGQSNRMREQFYLNNMMRVDVYMKDLNSEQIVHQPTYDYIHLLGDVGGLLGLFLGASILSVLEIIDLFVHQLFKWIMAHDLSNL